MCQLKRQGPGNIPTNEKSGTRGTLTEATRWRRFDVQGAKENSVGESLGLIDGGKKFEHEKKKKRPPL